MRRFVTDHAEIVHGTDDAPAKNVLPYSIHHHAGRQRIFGTGYDFRKLTPSAAGTSLSELASGSLVRIVAEQARRKSLHYRRSEPETPFRDLCRQVLPRPSAPESLIPLLDIR